ncbi:MAG: hypothetical protein ABS916_00140 [Carnobacterium sp.]|uniref:hypothetical protein n=1 Tax=Carnobacterium sp. TaxID=48221 RepID=UPI00331476B6
MGDNLNWERFEDDPFYSQILTYWYDEWNSISEEVKKGMIGIDIVNIRIVLLDIINEYELNQFESENNRKVYIKLIETLLSKTYISVFKEELLILKEKLEKKEKRAVYVISKDLSNLISEQSFAYVLFDELFPILEGKSFEKKDRLKVKEVTREIIIDLITSGMDIEDVKKFVSDSFETYFIHEDNVHISYKGIPKEIDTDKEKIAYIDGLSIQKRLDLFKENLLFNESKYIFIYPIWGMFVSSRENNEDLIFGCKLYSPDFEKVFKEDSIFDETFDTSGIEAGNKELDYKDRHKYQSRCNAKILVTATSQTSAKKIAEAKLSNLLNMLNLYYANNHHEFFWDGQYIGSKFGVDFGSFASLFGSRDDKKMRRNISKNNPIALTENKYKNTQDISQLVEELKKKEMLYEAKTILSVIDIMSKARWQTDEDKILSYWIAVESLANISKRDEETKFHFIKETISNIYFLWEKYEPTRNLFRLTDFYSQSFFQSDDTINLPTNFLQDVKIYESHSEGFIISLVSFYKRMEELKDYTTKEVYLDEIEDTLLFYKNNKEALKRIKEIRREVKLTIDYIYKCRNQIVHNGYVDKNLIPYLVNFSEQYANALFKRILDVYMEGEFNLQNYFTKEIYDGSLLEKRLSNKTHYDLGFVE